MLEPFIWNKRNLHTIDPAGYAFREKDKKNPEFDIFSI